MKKKLYSSLFLLTLVVAAGCDSKDGLTGIEAEGPAREDSDLEVEGQHAVLATAEMDDGSSVSWVGSEGVVLTAATGGKAALTLMAVDRSGGADPASVYEMLSGDATAPKALLDAVSEIGRARKRVDSMKMSSILTETQLNDPDDFTMYFGHYPVCVPELEGTRNVYVDDDGRSEFIVHSRYGWIDVNVYIKRYDIFGNYTGYEWLGMHNRIHGSQTSYMSAWTLWKERFKIRITNASNNYYHVAGGNPNL